MHIALIEKEKQAALLSLTSAPVMLSLGEVQRDSSSVRIVVWLQRHNHVSSLVMTFLKTFS
jgi:hypothetical protein